MLDFFPGSHYGEYRINNGLLINGRFDKILSNSLSIGYRFGTLTLGNTDFIGHGIKIGKIYQGIIFNLSSSISNNAISNRNLEKVIISGGITFGII